MTARRTLVIGASGYVGTRLVSRLLDRGERVRVLARDPAKVHATSWGDRVEVHVGDVTSAHDVAAATEDVDVVHYLVHSLSRSDFTEIDRAAAEAVAGAAAAAGVSRIVYLGGVRPADDRPVSRHMASRLEVGEVFLRGAVPATVVQAAIIIGSGSTSFEILRYLAERLPVMPAPGWVDNRVQPVAIEDVLHYLCAAADLPGERDLTVDIGCPEVLTYWEIIRRYARVAGLPTPIRLPAPPVPAGLVGQVLGELTPVDAAVATPLIESLHHDMVCDPDTPTDLPEPPGGPCTVEQAMRAALPRGHDRAPVFDRTGSADRPGGAAEPVSTDLPGSGGPRFTERIARGSRATPEQLWRVVEGIGGDRGYHGLPVVWQLRGLLDRVLGGVGGYRGRRDPDHLRTGEILDWWQVERVGAHRLVLRAEMKMPGTAWLELRVEPREGGGSRLHQTVVFEPSGPFGHAYWWAQRPAHVVVFQAMALGIVRAAEKLARDDPGGDTTGRRPGWAGGLGVGAGTGPGAGTPTVAGSPPGRSARSPRGGDRDGGRNGTGLLPGPAGHTGAGDR